MKRLADGGGDSLSLSLCNRHWNPFWGRPGFIRVNFRWRHCPPTVTAGRGGKRHLIGGLVPTFGRAPVFYMHYFDALPRVFMYVDK